jgi:5'-3' exoribonuclease 1
MFQVNYMPSYQISRSLGISPRCLSMLTGSTYFRADDKKVDLGLCVKHVQQSLCVPDYARPQSDQQGWQYSQALLQIVQKYKVQHCRSCKKMEKNSHKWGHCHFDGAVG